jgi:hypothetical protein
MTDFTFWAVVSIIEATAAIREVVPFLGLAILALYLPPLMITRLLFHLRRRKGPLMRFLSHPIGPSIPGPGADRSALGHALKQWAVLCLKTVPLALASGLALFGVMAGGWLTIAFVIAMCAALFAFVVSGVECLFLLVRLVLHGPRTRRTRRLFATIRIRRTTA